MSRSLCSARLASGLPRDAFRQTVDRERGFTLAAAIFLLVVLALLGAAIVRFAGFQHGGAAQDLDGARAYQAARAGIEWGLYQLLSPTTDAVGNLNPPACFASPAAVAPSGTLAAFAVTVSCTRTPATELNRNLAVYQLVARASLGAAGSAFYVEREVQATVSRCKDPAGVPPRYACP